jgi:hypothetical protein
MGTDTSRMIQASTVRMMVRRTQNASISVCLSALLISALGDTDNQQQLTLLCKQYDTRQFWTTYKKKKDLNAIVTKRRTMPPPDLINPSEGRMDSWQLGESAEAFVKRLSPLAPSSLQYEWIWVRDAELHSPAFANFHV